MPAKSTRDRFKGFGDFVQQMMAQWQVPGCAIGIVKDSDVLLLQGFGLRDVKKKQPVTPQTLFAIGSCTKAFTTMAMGMLVDEGKLAWDTPVRQYWSDFRLSDAGVTERITPRDLVTHLSGLPRHDLLWYGSPLARRELMARLRHLELNKDLRQSWQYNNLMYAAAGMLIEHLSGQTWEQFIQARIFAPLGMKHSDVSATDMQKRKDHAQPYQRDRETDEIKWVPFRNIDNIGPAGSINSCAADMLKWLMLHLNKGQVNGKPLISEANLKLMHSPQAAVAGANEMDPEFGQMTYGLGWVINSWRGHEIINHGGGIDGFLTLTTLLPAEHLGLFVINNLGGSPLNEVLAFNAIDRLLGLRPVPLAKRWHKREMESKAAAKKGQPDADAGRKLNTRPSHPLEDYAGEYEHPGYGRMTISEVEGHLLYDYNDIHMPLRHFHYDVFEGEYKHWETKFKVAFTSDTDGMISSLSIPLEPLVKAIVFTKLAPKVSLESLRQCVGDYEFADMPISVSLQGKDQLLLSLPNAQNYELIPIEGLRFKVKALDGFALEFKQGPDGTVTEILSQQPDGAYVWRRK